MKIQILILLFFLTKAVFAASSGNLFMKGVMPLKLKLEITPAPASSNLNLHQSQTDLKVARGSVVSNSPHGFKVLVSSENEGNLRRIGGTQTFPYTMKYGGMRLPLTRTATEFISAGKIDSSGDLTVSYLGKPREQMDAGEYQDTVKFTILSR